MLLRKDTVLKFLIQPKSPKETVKNVDVVNVGLVLNVVNVNVCLIAIVKHFVLHLTLRAYQLPTGSFNARQIQILV